ncbi:glycosyltransferase family 4 protein [Arcicella rosea]|uniref:UDP-GlcNAc:undecaprenyl-phosphate GlcNAc-1-phosphate transferase n=1 Tax=Arcicella rosea TaxID=502909 RepID=A0A841EVS5_9BACT|nr:MraY family glycosyltransferase [Arcicella rosea]MBB6005163.1 UDP-GlcNAc:undecaprenyl-phosphate GlcNAc-1-phosphate transferase [Arcicella rosea]
MNTSNKPLIILGAFCCIFSFVLNGTLLKYLKIQTPKKANSQIRWSISKQPTLGGISFYLSFLIMFFYTSQPSYSLLLPLTLAFGIGLIDDYFVLSPFFKLLGQLLIALLIVKEHCIYLVDNNVVNTVFTFFWIIGLMNAINMLDNMDGILASTVLIILLVALIIRPEASSLELNFYIVYIVGALISFLYFNWQPAKMYMGDSGSQFLGAFLAWISIQYFWIFRDESIEGFQIKQFLVPVLAFIIPIIDTSTVIYFRIKKGISPFIGGKDHLTHHLVYAGFSERQAVILLSIISLFSGMIIFFIEDIVGTNQWRNVCSIIVAIYILLVWLLLQIMYEKGEAKKVLS